VDVASLPYSPCSTKCTSAYALAYKSGMMPDATNERDAIREKQLTSSSRAICSVISTMRSLGPKCVTVYRNNSICSEILQRQAIVWRIGDELECCQERLLHETLRQVVCCDKQLLAAPGCRTKP
jgi:hypothetical protein